MPIVPSTLVSIGIITLCLGLVQAHNICSLTKHKGWTILSSLIVGFIIGYAYFLSELLLMERSNALVLGVSLILFGGSIFVVMVVRYSLVSISDLNKLALEEQFNALHDSLTSLPNRKSCNKEIDKRIHEGQGFSVLLFDVINFKQVNDALGHSCGDELLIQIAKRVSKVLKSDEMLARLGGDEFVIITTRHSTFEVTQLVNFIELSLKEQFFVNNFEVSTGVVFGSSQFPEDAITTAELIDYADVGMYHAKNSGQVLSHYHSDMTKTARFNLSISGRIPNAIENNEFMLYYQPIICPDKNRVTEYEALIRWKMEDGSYIPPAKFIPIAEQSNKITDITIWVLEQVCRDLSTLTQNDVCYPIHINLSAKDVIGNKLYKALADIAASNPTFTQLIVVEVTETATITNIPNCQERLERIQRLGYNISLDDFGTGYSSLSLLRDLPIDQIKIDRNFINDISFNTKNKTIVETAIRLAHGLGYSIVAEGVEEKETLDLLKEMKCDFIQGYYFSEPYQLEEIIRWTKDFHMKSAVS
ncbi:putative bifunctional diguanylate cyclase/phosphodiesterase [Vibrio profundi]|uniref:putative bifunctional diguanylate cyclase/phosphodiesterase n=1 Tax=Vibrio profundi TaxID=1774960 RepID=UPI003735E72B